MHHGRVQVTAFTVAAIAYFVGGVLSDNSACGVAHGQLFSAEFDLFKGYNFANFTSCCDYCNWFAASNVTAWSYSASFQTCICQNPGTSTRSVNLDYTSGLLCAGGCSGQVTMWPSDSCARVTNYRFPYAGEEDSVEVGRAYNLFNTSQCCDYCSAMDSATSWSWTDTYAVCVCQNVSNSNMGRVRAYGWVSGHRCAGGCKGIGRYCGRRLVANGVMLPRADVPINATVYALCKAGYTISNATLAVSTCVYANMTANYWSSPLLPTCVANGCDTSLVLWMTGATVSDASPNNLTLLVAQRFPVCEVQAFGVSKTCITNDGDAFGVDSAQVALRFPSGRASRSMCAFAYNSRAPDETQAAFLVSYGRLSPNEAFFIGVWGERLLVGGFGNDLVTDNGVWPARTWIHVCATYQALNANVTLFVNGAIVASELKPDWNIPNVNVSARIGSQVFSAPSWSGAFYDLRLYSRALLPAEVATLAASGGCDRKMGCLD